MTIKSCLKSNQPTPVPSPGPDGSSLCSKSKCVAWCQKSEQVWFADEWDRTPTEPVRNLSYQDMLELKAIQNSLPIAPQPIDPLARRQASQRLPKVPVGLLPLLPSESTPAAPEAPKAPEPKEPEPSIEPCPSPKPVTYSAPSSLFPRGFAMRQERPPSPPRIIHQPTPRHLTHLPSAKPTEPPKRRSTFSFVPLLETPPQVSEEDSSPDPPTPSLTNASLDSTPNPSPRSRPSSSPDTPSYMQLPPAADHSYFPPFEDCHDPAPAMPLMTFKRMNLGPIPSPSLQPPSPLVLNSPSVSTREPEEKLAGHPPVRRKKQVIVINDMEIELDEEEEAPAPAPVPPSPSSSPTRSKFGSRFNFVPLAGAPPISCSPPRPPTSPPISCS